MLLATPVAMAMLPEKVVHDARAEASPAFWMVVVAALQEDWAGWVLVFVLLPVVRASSLTSDTSSGNGHYGRDVLERHLVINGSWITDGWVSCGLQRDFRGSANIGVGHRDVIDDGIRVSAVFRMVRLLIHGRCKAVMLVDGSRRRSWRWTSLTLELLKLL
jgi:hypothetical protein